jgi:CrcB protein
VRTLLAIAAGGALGSVLRFAAGVALSGAFPAFPVATLLVNVVGSFVLGALATALPATAGPALRLGLTVGLCGGFTTFSTFSAEVVTLAQRGLPARAASYGVASVALSVAAALAGMAAGRALAAR